jgi:hypothetical protein
MLAAHRLSSLELFGNLEILRSPWTIWPPLNAISPHPLGAMNLHENVKFTAAGSYAATFWRWRGEVIAKSGCNTPGNQILRNAVDKYRNT